MVKSVQYGAAHHTTGAVEMMPLALERHGEIEGRIGKAGAQGRVRSAAIVMHKPRPQSSSQMLFGYRDHPIQALTPEGPNQPFAERICLRAAHRRFDDLKAHACYRRIELGGEDRVAVMQDKLVRVI